MQVGISSACFYPELIEDALKFLCENSVPKIEIFFNTFCEMEGKVFKDVQSILKDSDTKVVSVHPFTCAFEPFLLFTNYERRFEDGLEFYKRYFDACNKLGAKITVFHGDKAESKTPDELYFERYHRVFLTAKAQGITFAQENVAYCRSKSPEFVEKMRQQLGDDVAFVLDLKQARRGGTDYKAMADAMGDKIAHFHANDYDDLHDCLLPLCGKCDFNEVIAYLKQKGYNGDAIIEVYRQNYNEHSELITSMNNLQKIC